MCLSCICLLAMHTLICVTLSLPPGIRGWLRLLLVALPGLFCLPFYKSPDELNARDLLTGIPKISCAENEILIDNRIYQKYRSL